MPPPRLSSSPRLLLAVAILALGLAPAAGQAAVVRQPYLQHGTPTSMTIVWRTNSAPAGDSELLEFGQTFGVYDQSTNATPVVPDATFVSGVWDHVATINGLTPDTKYYYRVGGTGSTGNEAGGTVDHFFVTSPPHGSTTPFTAWILGDSGDGSTAQQNVRDSMLTYTTGDPPDLFLHVGDIAYNDGTDAEWTTNHFAQYSAIQRNTVFWPAIGNHDSFVSGFDPGNGTGKGPYFDAHVLPTNAEIGGVASGTESYYSFDYANAHFTVLNSHDTDATRRANMLAWLTADLQSTEQQWLIVFWHHPPYSKGSHDSDSEAQMVWMRENVLPLLEANGVDLVLTGHSHNYERSCLIDEVYTTPTPAFGTLLAGGFVLDEGDGDPAGDGSYVKAPAAHDGAVYLVTGHGGRSIGTPGVHPVMCEVLGDGEATDYGSTLLTVDGSTLTVEALLRTGTVNDSFSIVKADWVAYNDLNDGANIAGGSITDDPDLGDGNATNATGHDYYAVAEPLVDFFTGDTLGATVTGRTGTTPAGDTTGCADAGNDCYDPTSNDDSGQMGAVDPGTDADRTFDGNLDYQGMHELDVADWDNVVEFNDLDPNKTYSIALTANRNNVSYAGARFTRVSILGAATFENASTSGVVVNGPDSVSFSTGYNPANGYVARWTHVSTGPDGSFAILSEWDDSQGGATTPPNDKGYAMGVFELMQFSTSATITEDFESGFPLGQPVGDHADWFNGAGGPVVTAGAGVNGSIGLAPGGSVFAWTGQPFDWNDPTFFAVRAAMDFQTDGSGEYDDDRVGFTISGSDESSSNVFGAQLDPGGGGPTGQNIEGYWDGVSTPDVRPSIVDLPALTPDTFYRFIAEITKLRDASHPMGPAARVEVSLWSLDGSGAPLAVVASGSIADTSLLGADEPHPKYFTGPIYPAFKNHTGTTGGADNASVTLITGTAPFVCTMDSECDDSDLCTTDTCVSGTCTFDAVMCPVDQVCNPANGDCEAAPVVLSFQQGVNGYTSTVDTYLRSGATTEDHSTDPILIVDGDEARHILLRFDDIIGAGPDQVPDDATVLSAELHVEITDASATGASLHRMLQTWNDTDTWSTWVGGIAADGVEAEVAADVSDPGSSPGTRVLDVTASLQAWLASPGSNFGWAWLPGGDDSWRFDSAEGTTPPLLVVTVAAPESCTADIDCDDGNPCNGDETCNLGLETCEAGTPLSCDPGEVCAPETGLCEPEPVTLMFQEGVSGSATSQDSFLQETAPSNVNGTAAAWEWDDDDPDGSGNANYGLLRWDDLFGSGVDQIPFGATIDSATLTLNVFNPGVTATVHQMLVDWGEADSLTDVCGAACNSGQEFDTTPIALAQGTPTGNVDVDVTASLQAWLADPASNHGWLFAPPAPGVSGGGVEVRSREYGTPAERPKLSVTFRPVRSCTGDPDCDDGNACTDETCNLGTMLCEVVANTAACDDGIGCTENDVCGGGSCQPGAPNDGLCDDSNVCTDDVCNPSLGCEATNNTAVCDDGVSCTGGDVCSGGSCQGTDSCVGGEICDVNSDMCVTPPTLVTFQQDVTPYQGTVDTYIQEDPASTDNDNSAAQGFGWDADDPSGSTYDAYALLRFAGLIGSGPDRIPAGATIDEATLVYTVGADSGGPEGDDGLLHEVLVPWPESVSWNGFGGDPGASAGDEYDPTSVGTLIAPGAGSFMLDVTSSVQAWIDDPDSNFGWIVLPTGSNGVDLRSSEYQATPGDRPQLSVSYFQGPACSVDADCNDGVSCTTDSCDAGVCSYATTCGPDEVCDPAANVCQAEAMRVSDGLVVLYGFAEGEGSVVEDVSGNGTPLDLDIADPGAVAWVPGGGLDIVSSAVITSPGPASKVTDAILASGEVTIEAWAIPIDTTQFGPARMVALSQNAFPDGANFVLGQSADRYETRFRTTINNQYGSSPATIGPADSADGNLAHVVFTRDATGATTLYVNGAPVATENPGSSLGNWNASYPLTLANEPQGDRTWLGRLHLVAIYDRDLSGAEVNQNLEAGPILMPEPSGPLALALSVALLALLGRRHIARCAGRR